MIVWRARGKIIRSVLCSIVRNSCAQCNAHTYEQTNSCLVVSDLGFLWLYCVLQFICVEEFIIDSVCSVFYRTELLCPGEPTPITLSVRFSFLGLFCVIVYLCVCAFVVLDLISSLLCQEIGWEERLRNGLFCVEWDVKP